MNRRKTPSSPQWPATTKTIVILVLLVIFAAILIRFANLIPMIATALLIVIVMRPVAALMVKKLKMSWGLASGILFVTMILLVLGVFTWGGVSIIDEIQGLIDFLSNITTDLTSTIQNLAEIKFNIGPFLVDFSVIDWATVGEQILGILQPILSGIGNSIGGIASGAIGAIANLFLTLILAYLILNESERPRERNPLIAMSGYEEDLRHFGREMRAIWNTYFRGQAQVFIVRVFIYLVLLGFLRVRYFVLLAVLAGLANFIPYIGVAIAWTVYFLVALFQGTTVFGLEPFTYAAIVAVSGWLIDNIYDNVYTPRVMAGSLKIHPAAITIGALIGLELFGIMGMIFASPILATLKLFLRYISRKLFDLDPWEDIEAQYHTGDVSGFFGKTYQQVQDGAAQVGEKIGNIFRRK